MGGGGTNADGNLAKNGKYLERGGGAKINVANGKERGTIDKGGGKKGLRERKKFADKKTVCRKENRGKGIGNVSRAKAFL